MKREIMPIIKKKDLNELVGGDMNSSGGDKNTSGDSEIETGPVQKSHSDLSDYEKGEPPTSDKVFGRYRQNIPWFAVYSYGGTRSTGNGGGGRVNETSTKTRVINKKSVEEKIEDLVKRSKSTDVTDKNYNPKIAKLIDTITDADLTEKQLEDLKQAIQHKVISGNTSKNL